MTRTSVTVLCGCSWTGTIGATADCPSCGRNKHSRVTSDRLKVLVAFHLGQQPRMVPGQRDWLIERKLIEPAGPEIEPSDKPRRPAPQRLYRLTELGAKVVASAGVKTPPPVTTADILAIADLVVDLLEGGVACADAEDEVGAIKVHLAEGPPRWLQDAAREAVAQYRAARGGAR